VGCGVLNENELALQEAAAAATVFLLNMLMYTEYQHHSYLFILRLPEYDVDGVTPKVKELALKEAAAAASVMYADVHRVPTQNLLLCLLSSRL
jgi:hypothetical protein